MISPCDQEQGGILLKFNILRLYYVTHYCARIGFQPFRSSPEVIQEACFAQNGQIISKPLKNCLYDSIRLQYVVISWNHYTGIFNIMKITVRSFFHNSQWNWPLGLLFLKFSGLLRQIFLNLFLFSPDFFFIFHNIVIIYNARNWSNDTTERKKKIPVLILMLEESETWLSNVW